MGQEELERPPLSGPILLIDSEAVAQDYLETVIKPFKGDREFLRFSKMDEVSGYCERMGNIPSLAIVDTQLEQGDVWSVINVLREKFPQTPIVVTSADTVYDFKSLAEKKKGVSYFMAKPFDEDLAMRLETLLTHGA